MRYERMLWLPGVLRAAGLLVAEVPGWQDRGHTDQGDFTPRALMFHHDASDPGNSPGSLSWIIDGFDSGTDDHYDAQCWVDRQGIWHVVASGYAEHAGSGIGWGAVPAGLGNQFSLGVETDHTTGEMWPAAQLRSVERGCAAICKARGWDPLTSVTGHKEYAKGRKTDPDGIDMFAFRAELRRINEEDDVSYDDVVRALRDVLRLPSNGLAVPRGQTDNGNLAAILVGMAQAEVTRDAAGTAEVRALAARLDVHALADAVAAKLHGSQISRDDVKTAVREALADHPVALPTPVHA
jgi:hypothetical protein